MLQVVSPAAGGDSPPRSAEADWRPPWDLWDCQDCSAGHDPCHGAPQVRGTTGSSPGHHILLSKYINWTWSFIWWLGNNHWLIITWSSPDHCLIIAWSSPDHRLIIAWSSPDHRLIIAWSSPDHHLIITWSSPDHHQIITRYAIDDQILITSSSPDIAHFICHQGHRRGPQDWSTGWGRLPHLLQPPHPDEVRDSVAYI